MVKVYATMGPTIDPQGLDRVGSHNFGPARDKKFPMLYGEGWESRGNKGEPLFWRWETGGRAVTSILSSWLVFPSFMSNAILPPPPPEGGHILG